MMVGTLTACYSMKWQSRHAVAIPKGRASLSLSANRDPLEYTNTKQLTLKEQQHGVQPLGTGMTVYTVC